MTSKLLIEACEKGDLETIVCLHVKNSYEWRFALTTALRYNHPEIITWIAENRVMDIDTYPLLSPGDLLDWAAGANNLGLVKMALDKGATNVVSALSRAVGDGHIEIINELLLWGASPNKGLYQACVSENQDMMIYMINKGALKCNNCGRSMKQHLESTVLTDLDRGLDLEREK